MNKKIILVVVGALLLTMAGQNLVAEDAAITGTFNPTTTMTANLWNTSMTWGDLAYNANVTANSQLNNTGSVKIDSTICNDSYSGGLTLVIEAQNDAEDEFACIYNSVDISWADMGTEATPATLDADIALAGTSPFTVNIVGNGVGWSIDHAEQSFNLTVAYTENVA